MLAWLAAAGVAVHLSALWLVHYFYTGADSWWLVPPFQYAQQHPRYSPKGATATDEAEAAARFKHDIFPDGRFADLPLSHTRYYLLGPEDGRKVVFVHGIAAPSVVFLHVAKHLASLGMRVLLYDLPGRGLSSTYPAIHDEKYYVAHLSTLMKHVGWSRFALFGYSMGGAISVAYSDAFPDEVERLVLFAPAGLLPEAPAFLKFARIPPFGELVMLTSGPKTMKRNTRRNFRKQHAPGAQETMQAHDDQVDFHPGYLTAFLLSVRYFPMSSMDGYYARVGRHSRKLMVLWGTADHVVPFESSAHRVKQLMPNATFVFLDDLNHNAIIEDPEHAFQSISSFFEN